MVMGPYPAEKADFTPFTFLQTRTNLLSSLLMNSKLDRGKSSAPDDFAQALIEDFSS
jgi:hypothetical protein